jgi:hypothetical protein
MGSEQTDVVRITAGEIGNSGWWVVGFSFASLRT